MSAAAGFALLAGAAGLLGLRELLGAGAGGLLARTARLVAGLAEALARLGGEGRDPGAVERRRLLGAGVGVAFLAGTAVLGLSAGLVLAACGPLAVSRMLRARRLRYRRAVERGAPQIALALADALGGGHSLRGALAEAATCVPGQAGYELRRVAAELAAGAPTDDALEALRVRTRSARVDVLVAACLLQRRAGGDLARLLRDSARAMEEQAQLEDEVRAATAQARFTGLIVVLLPLGGAGLAELATPGWLAGLWGSFLTAWLVGIALVLQAAAALLIRRLGRVRW